MKIRVVVFRFVLLASFVLSLGCQQQTPAPLPPVINSQPSTVPALPPKEPPKQAPAPSLEAAWKTYKDKDEGFEIAYPPLWLVLTKEQITKAEAKVGGGKVFLFYAVDVVSGIISKPEFLEYPGSFSISKVSIKQEIPLSSLEKEAVRDIESDPDIFKPVSSTRVALSPGEAIKLQYTRKLSNRSGPVVFIQYMFVKGNNYYAFTTETEPNSIEKYAPLYEKMAKSFRFVQ